MQAELGDIVYVELPEAGSEVEKGSNFGVVESVKVSNSLCQYKLLVALASIADPACWLQILQYAMLIFECAHAFANSPRRESCHIQVSVASSRQSARNSTPLYSPCDSCLFPDIA